MWTLNPYLDLLFGLAFVAWATALYSLVRADMFGRIASRHLPRAERTSYRRNLFLFPRGAWVEPLLSGTGTEAHRRAVTHMRRVHLAAMVFAVVCVVAVLAGMLANGIKRDPSVFDRPGRLELSDGASGNGIAPAAVDVAIVRPAGVSALAAGGRRGVVFGNRRGAFGGAFRGYVGKRSAFNCEHSRAGWGRAGVGSVELPLERRRLAAVVSAGTEKQSHGADCQQCGYATKVVVGARLRRGHVSIL